MKFLSRCALLAASCTFAAAAMAQPITVADVKYDETTSVGGSTLLLKGLEADTAVILERKTPVSCADVALCVQRHQFDNR